MLVLMTVVHLAEKMVGPLVYYLVDRLADYLVDR